MDDLPPIVADGGAKGKELLQICHETEGAAAVTSISLGWLCCRRSTSERFFAEMETKKRRKRKASLPAWTRHVRESITSV
jgi:hypothetical protein